MTASARDQIDAATVLLERRGIKKTVKPLTLVKASRELGKSQKETLDYIGRLFRAAQGG